MCTLFTLCPREVSHDNHLNDQREEEYGADHRMILILQQHFASCGNLRRDCVVFIIVIGQLLSVIYFSGFFFTKQYRLGLYIIYFRIFKNMQLFTYLSFSSNVFHIRFHSRNLIYANCNSLN